jgi:hypothetical protein
MSDVISRRCDCCQKEKKPSRYDGWVRIAAEQQTMTGMTLSSDVRILINDRETLHSNLDFCSPECAGKALFAGVR